MLIKNQLTDYLLTNSVLFSFDFKKLLLFYISIKRGSKYSKEYSYIL